MAAAKLRNETDLRRVFATVKRTAIAVGAASTYDRGLVNHYDTLNGRCYRPAATLEGLFNSNVGLVWSPTGALYRGAESDTYYMVVGRTCYQVSDLTSDDYRIVPKPTVN